MGLWDKLQSELDRAGTAAKGALDEGKIRIELFRVRQQADKAAQALGYALHRAKREGRELEDELMASLLGTLTRHEDEAKKLEEEIASTLGKSATPPPAAPAAPGSDGTPSEPKAP